MLAEVLARLNIETPRVPISEECREFLRGHKVPKDIVEDLAASSFATWIRVNTLTLVPMWDLVDQMSGIRACIEHGYLAVAGGANGDPVTVNLSNRRMYFVSHELLCAEEWEDFAECVHAIPFVYDDFWNALVSDDGFPWDYYEARDRWPPERTGPRIWNPGL